MNVSSRCDASKYLHNVTIVVSVAGENLYEVVQRTCAWKCGLDLSVESNKLSPRHDGDCEFRTVFHVIWGVRWGGPFDIGHDER